MNVLMVTPHLPPHQAANAILPDLLGRGLRARGHAVDVLAFDDGHDREGVATVRRRRALARARACRRRWRPPRPGGRRPRSSAAPTWCTCTRRTWMNQVAARLAHRHRRPYVLTHYGTEIWHHDGKDARFRRMNREAQHVTFYSQALLERARELAVPAARGASVVYPPVADEFRPLSAAERASVRARYGVGDGPAAAQREAAAPAGRPGDAARGDGARAPRAARTRAS